MAVKWVRNGVQAKTNGHKAGERRTKKATKEAARKAGMKPKLKAKPKSVYGNPHDVAETKRRQAAARKDAANKMRVAKASGRVETPAGPAGEAVKMADVMMHVIASTPKEPLSPGMQALVDYGKELLIVRAPKGTISNRDEFTQQMGALGFKVVYLEHMMHTLFPPIIERYQRP